MELGALKGGGQLAIEGLDAKRRQTTDLSAFFAEEVRVVVNDGTAGIEELVAPNPVPQVHSSEQAGFREVSQNSPDGRLVVGAFRQGPHHLLVGEWAGRLVEDDQDGDASTGGTQSMPADERAHFVLNVFEVLGQAGLRGPA